MLCFDKREGFKGGRVRTSQGICAKHLSVTTTANCILAVLLWWLAAATIASTAPNCTTPRDQRQQTFTPTRRAAGAGARRVACVWCACDTSTMLCSSPGPPCAAREQNAIVDAICMLPSSMCSRDAATCTTPRQRATPDGWHALEGQLGTLP